MNSPLFETRAKELADFLSKSLGLKGKVRKAIILGTGWKKTLPFVIRESVPFSQMPHFIELPEIKGHERNFGVGTYKGEDILVLDGRIHLNEIPQSEILVKIVRWQIQLLYYLGVRKLISTSAVGSISNIPVGSVVIINDFFAIHAPTVLYGGEFNHVNKALHHRLKTRAVSVGKNIFGKNIQMVTHVMVRGPRLETEADQFELSRTKAQVVGMSQLPDAEVVSLYKGFYMLGLCLVTNKSGEKTTHEDNLRRASQHHGELKDFLSALIPLL